ncbi:carbohydrate sulfotransferase 12-like [Ruditapes philippinarum]|uniref:carbohydrate sulfotransferase 12-like n=1 Tax=Ruditapes philippinarum TaxID=129788 RepID=UPI00295AAEDB|nr:carbohydrate sulfotransferase 12-like [Ruditapes philippinarum]
MSNTLYSYYILLQKSAISNKRLFGKTTTYPTDGYKRAELLREKCSSSVRNLHARVRVSYNKAHNILYCPLCKIASTFWTRAFKTFEYEKRALAKKHPYEIKISDAPRSDLYFDTSSEYIKRSHGSRSKINAKGSFKFLFVRNPFRKLFSAFVDKIVGPNPIFWKVFKTKPEYYDVVNTLCGADLKFGQFLKNIVQTVQLNNTLDCHVKTFNACEPCAMNYTFVGKMETFKEDTFHILSKCNQNETFEKLAIFEKQFSSLHADDAIDDSITSPFSWTDEIRKCIPWAEALQRIWRKLQIRGVIGMQAFPLSDREAERINETKFIELVKKTRLRTTSKERQWQKEYAFMEAYQTVPSNVINDIRKIYSRDFKLFDYDDIPNNLFKTDASILDFKFLDYSNVKENYYPNIKKSLL